jgi:hypothetical protein
LEGQNGSNAHFSPVRIVSSACYWRSLATVELRLRAQRHIAGGSNR